MLSPAHYQVVFDLSQKPYQWWFPAVGLIAVIIGGFMIWVSDYDPGAPARTRSTGYVFVAFGSLWAALVFAGTFSEYYDAHSHYVSREYNVVEGPVTNFRPMPYEGHRDECFSVQDKTFCYSDYGIQPGFNHSASHGGPIREGLPVRVSYVGDVIVRLEVQSPAANTTNR